MTGWHTFWDGVGAADPRWRSGQHGGRAAGFALGVCVALLAACGTDNALPPTDTPPVDTAINPDFTPDVGTEPKADSLVAPDAGELPDTPAPPGDAAPDSGPAPMQPCQAPGDWGCACKGNGDCLSNYCIETSAGSLCSKSCVDTCPSNWSCVQVQGTTDITYLCVPPFQTLCRPCDGDDDCMHVGAEAGANRCIPNEPTPGFINGSFCGAACTADTDCPGSFACKEVLLGDKKLKQCVPTTGQCGCTADQAKKGVSTSCSIQNDAGICGGYRLCTADGLSLCSAATPVMELCDGKDNDCDGKTDEGFVYDDVGTPKALGKPCGTGACLGGEVVCAPDGSKAICSAGGKNLEEVCDFQDNDCDGKTDEDLGLAESDCLKLGVCANGQVVAECKVGAWKCDYGQVWGFESGGEKSCDKLDNDCDGKTDEDFVYQPLGAPSPLAIGSACDGIGACGQGVVQCAAGGIAMAVCSTDPAGSESGAQAEKCNGLDDDCDGVTDEGCDDDKDGYCDKSMGFDGNPAACPKGGGDCDDTKDGVHPNAIEVCNDGDDDCDGKVDNGCDDDQDGFCDAAMKVVGEPKVCVHKELDCDDKNDKIFPGASEVCDAVDNDCNGKIDAGDPGLSKSAPPCENLKGVCKGSVKPASLCQGGQWQPCNDTVYTAHAPSFENAVEEQTCDADDNNCDGVVDEKCDVDGDGWCTSAKKTTGKPATCGKGGGDCDDGDKAINPGAKEICDDLGVDENCNGLKQEPGASGCVNYYPDDDKDGWGKKGAPPKCLCAPDGPGGYTAKKTGDCNDDVDQINPGKIEDCKTGFDDNCNGLTNEEQSLNCVPIYLDVDGDGWGDKKAAPKCMCQIDFQSKYIAFKGGDCNDSAQTINPGVQELCSTPEDDNCNGPANEAGSLGCQNYYKDGDKDGYGAKGSKPICLCAPEPVGGFSSSNSDDCNDGNGGIKPGINDNCLTVGVDDNCDGKVDLENSAGCKPYYFDGDTDGYGLTISKCLCVGDPASKYTAKTSGDCNDGDPAIRPGATEICNGIDDNCVSGKDEGASATCKTVPAATAVCSSGACIIGSCTSTRFDVDKKYDNGCECQADPNFGKKGNTCANFIDAGTYSDAGSFKVFSGNIMPGEDGDWYRFYAQDLADSGTGACDSFNVRVQLVSNPGDAFRFDMFRGSCAGGNQLCKDETYSTWQTNYYGAKSGPGTKPDVKLGQVQPSPIPNPGGECKCATVQTGGGQSVAGMNLCSDNAAYFYVFVHLKAGVAANCNSYQIRFANNK